MRTIIAPLLLASVAACGITPEPGSRASADASRDAEEGPTVIEKVQYAALDDGRTAILLTVEEGGEAPDEITWSFAGSDVALSDNGRDGDAKAEDRVYTGVSADGMEEHDAARETYANALADLDAPMATQFAGLHATSRAEVEADFATTPELEEVTLDELGGTFEAATIFPMVSDVDGAPLLPPSAYDPYRTLLVTEPDLIHNGTFTGSWQLVNGDCVQVGNPNGPAGFRYLMGEIANGTMSADQFISDWVNVQWTNRSVNGYAVSWGMGTYTLHNGDWFGGNPPHPWPKIVDDGNASTFTDVLDGYETPLQLTAVVNRFDLAAGGYSGGGEAELRFVFTFLNEEDCSPANGNVILEYAVPLDGCEEVEHWAHLWEELDALDPTTPDYAEFLSTHIIEPIVTAGANPSRPNESNLKVLRTNEQVMIWPHYFTIFPTHANRDWRMEEWAVDATTHVLVNQTLAQTPGFDWVDPDFTAPSPYPQDIDAFIDANEVDILAGTHQVGATNGGSPFASPEVRYGSFAHAPGPYSNTGGGAIHNWRAMSWGSADVNSVEARQLFSLSTCSGCHAGETFEDGDGSAAFNSSNLGASVPGGQLEEPFRHIRPDANLQNQAHLSRFLTGTNATCTPGNEFVLPLGTMGACAVDTCCPIGDPVFGYTDGQVHFNEFARRGGILQDVILNGCSALNTKANSAIVASAH